MTDINRTVRGPTENILAQSFELSRMLDDLRGQLDSHFDRRVEPTTTESVIERPINPNVLDEIIENLDTDKAKLEKIMVFIRDDVLPKIN